MNSNIILILSVIIAFSNSLCIGLPIPQAAYYGWFAFIGLIGIINGVRINVPTIMTLFIKPYKFHLNLFNEFPSFNGPIAKIIKQKEINLYSA